MKISHFLFFATAMSAVQSNAQTPQPAPVAAPKQTAQQMFDAGSEAIVAADWKKAAEIYTTLETRLMAGKAGKATLAVVRLRKARAIARLEGGERAEPLLLAAMADIPANDASMADDVAAAHSDLGNVAESRYDFGGAMAHYRSAIAQTNDPVSRLQSYARLVPIGIFLAPGGAMADVDAALAVVAANPKTSPEWVGLFHDLRGRVLLNAGRLKEARGELDLSIKQLGGLHFGKVNLLDTAARSDAAIAALRDNDPEGARRYLAYAGAASQADQGFRLGRTMTPPQCGGEHGPKPDDVAIVEMSIRDDGSVSGALPIYYSGQPSAAFEFAKTVSKWSWSPEELKDVKPFFRLQTRLEMRCTNLFPRPSTSDLLVPVVEKWLAARGVAVFERGDVSDLARKNNLQSELARLEAAGAKPVALIPVLAQLAGSPAIPFKETSAYARRAFDIAIAENASPAVLVYLGLGGWGAETRGLDDYRKQLAAALSDSRYNSDLLARGALAILLYDSFGPGMRQRDGRPVLRAIADDPARPANDPFRVGALTRLASLDYDAGNIDAARENFSKSGLSAQQCALVDARPAAKSASITAYPEEALRWGFGGWTIVEFDISANGRTTNERPVVAFPPFVFGGSAVKGVQSFRYQQSYRPDGGLGCGGRQQRISYSSGL